jgi:hypothetical protein
MSNNPSSMHDISTLYKEYDAQKVQAALNQHSNKS